MSSTKGRIIECKAAVAWKKGEPLVIETIEVSPPKANEVRIKVEYTGVCHTDLSAWEGLIDVGHKFPCILGHEGSGIVESVGEGVISLKEGDHVITFTMPRCHECRACKSKVKNICMKILEIMGSQDFMADGTSRLTCKGQQLSTIFNTGTFSQYTVMEESQLAKVNRDAPLEKICILGCGVATGYGAAVNSAKVTPGSVCAVFGLGTVGLAAVMGCKQQGAARIIGVDISDEKKEIAKKFGVTEFYNPKEQEKPTEEVLVEKTQGGCDYTFECVGNISLMETAFNSCCLGGSKCVIIGASPSGQPVRIDPEKLLCGRDLIGSATGGFITQDVPGLVEDYMKKKILLDEFITSTSSIEGVNEVFQGFGKGGGVKHVMKL